MSNIVPPDIQGLIVTDEDHDEVRSKTHHCQLLRSISIGETERDRFNNYFEYLLSVLGYAAGFGSVWRFPYLVYKNGGGVFLIPYMIMLGLIGIPSFYFETALGQMFQRSPPRCFERTHKKWKGLGMFPLFTAFSASSYYNLILAYSFYFLYKSFSFPLPWKVEDDSPVPWNSDYFYKEVLHFSKGIDSFGGIVWPLFICYVLSQILVYFCIKNGVGVSGKIAMFTATSPYILLLLLLLRGLFLEGAFSGLAYLFYPDWSKLFSFSVWVDATNQAIFQMSTGGGVLVLFGSYRPISQEIKHSAWMIPLLTVLCGFLAAMVIFSFMGYMSAITGIEINEIPLRGPDLAFVVFPAVLTKMPFSNLLAVMFFITMVFLGIDTQFAFMDGLSGTVEEELKGKSLKITSFFSIPYSAIRPVICGLVALLGVFYCSEAGFYYLDLVDTYGVGFNLFMGLFIETYFFTWIEKWETIEINIRTYIKDPTPEFVIKLMTYSVPLFTGILGIISLVLQFQRMSSQPWWCTLIGWMLTLYPYCVIYHFYSKHKNDKTEEDGEIHTTSNQLTELIHY